LGDTITNELQVQRTASKGINMLRVRADTEEQADKIITNTGKLNPEIWKFYLRAKLEPAGSGWWIARRA
jgi:hypothetical protein